MLTHEKYFDALRSLNSNSAEWRSILAGLLVLRLIDSWLDTDEPLIVHDIAGIQAVQEALWGLQERDRTLLILRDLVEIVTQSAQRSVSMIAPLMLRYGATLHMANQWYLATDVFASLLSHALADRDSITIARASGRLAFALRHLGQLDASDHAYTLALEHVQPTSNPDLYFNIYSGRASNFAVRGQFKEAEGILDTVILEGSVRGLTELQGLAFHSRAFLASERFDYYNGVRLSRVALKLLSGTENRTYALLNLGAALVGYGDHHAAKGILLSTINRTQDDGARQRSLINLLEIAAKDEDRSSFDRYRQDIEEMELLPDLHAHYRLFLGKGYYNFGNMAAARESWERARAIAETHDWAHLRTTVNTEIATVTGQPFTEAL